MLPCSNVVEKEIVFGGEDRIDALIQGTTEILEAELYFVVTGCMVEMIGDDVLPIVNRFAQKGVNILAASTPGFKGNLFTGYDIVLQTLAENYVEKAEVKELHTVNILGVIPKQDVFFKGNLDEIKRLLSKLGIKANTFFGQGETLQNLRHAGKAKLNIVLSDIYGINVAQTFEAIHGIPYITADLPIGDTGTELFLRKVAETLQIDPQLVNAVIAEEKAYYYSYLERILESYADFDLQRYAIVAADSNYAFPLIRFVSDDLGWIPYLAYISDILEDWQIEKVRSKFSEIQSGQPNVIFDVHTGQLPRYIKERWTTRQKDNKGGKYKDTLNAAFILGSSLEASTAQAIGGLHLAVSFPVTNRVIFNRSYAGYKGGLTLAEDIFSVSLGSR
jgi:nitrogenase molybdenum-iron protein beta chain